MGGRTPYALRVTRPRDDLVERTSRRWCRVGLRGVLDDLDRAGETCPVPGEAAGEGFAWDEFDRDDHRWWPQGVASIRAGELLLVSWYAKRRWLVHTPGARISVIDRSDRRCPRYRHVLLVAPHRRAGILTAGGVRVHAGGIAVRGDLLYVADTFFGVRVFRLSDVIRTVTTRGSGAKDYVLPQLMRFRIPLRDGLQRLRYSFVSIGHEDGRPNLVVGEYRRKGSAPRLARYPLDPRTGLPLLDGHGRCAPLEIYERQPNRMQGAALEESVWFLTASAGGGNPGDLYVGAPGAWQRHRRVLPPSPEDLDWSVPGEELWCLSEWPGSRWVFPIAARDWHRPPGVRGHDARGAAGCPAPPTPPAGEATHPSG